MLNEVVEKLPMNWILGGLGAVFTVVAAIDSIFVVDQNEVANLRRLEQVVYDTPLTSGTHFKVPFIDKVDRAQISLRTLSIPTFSVNTIDNQKIDLDINFNYVLPASQANYLLYGVGQVEDSENDDIDDSIIPVAMDRAARVFAQQNTTKISLEREAIQADVQLEVFNAVRDLFGIDPRSLQIANIGYSKTFVTSNEEAVKAKNAAVAEENKKDVKTKIANQLVIEATGTADSKIKDAHGQAKSMILRANANKDSAILEAQGEKDRLLAEIAPFGKPDAYLKYLETQVKLKWDGVMPQVEVQAGASNSSNAPIVVPVNLKP